MLVVGDKEIEQGLAAVRLRSGDNIGPISLADVLDRVKRDINEHD